MGRSMSICQKAAASGDSILTNPNIPTYSCENIVGLSEWNHLCQSAGMLQVNMWEQRGYQTGITCGNLQGNFTHTHTHTHTHMHAHPSPWPEVAELSSFYEMKHHSPSFYTLSMGVIDWGFIFLKLER